MVDEGVTEGELRRAKNLAAAAFWKSIATIDGKARMLGEYEVIRGDWQTAVHRPGALRVGDARAAAGRARDILQRRRRTVGMLVPPAAPPPRAPAAGRCAVRVATRVAGRALACRRCLALALVLHRRSRRPRRPRRRRPRPSRVRIDGPRGGAGPVAGVKVPPFRRVVLPNGLTLLLMPIREVPLTAFSAVVRAGALADPGGQGGTRLADRRPAGEGRRPRDAFQFADAVADVGGSFGAGAGAESDHVGGQFLSRDRALMIELLADALLRPRLEAGEFGKLRERQVELIKASKDSDPSGLIDAYGRALLFGAHPYGSPVDGSERSLAAIDHDDVRRYWATRFGADRLTLVFAGDIDTDWLEAAVRRAFGGAPRATRRCRRCPSRRASAAAACCSSMRPVRCRPTSGSPTSASSRRYPARAALDIVNTLYGGRFTSILNTELRIKSGLSYGASSGFVRGSVPGEFAIRSFTQTENTVKAIDLALETLARLKRDGIAAEPHCSRRAPTCSASTRCGSRPPATGPVRSPTSSSSASTGRTSRATARRWRRSARRM